MENYKQTKMSPAEVGYIRRTEVCDKYGVTEEELIEARLNLVAKYLGVTKDELKGLGASFNEFLVLFNKRLNMEPLTKLENQTLKYFIIFTYLFHNFFT